MAAWVIGQLLVIGSGSQDALLGLLQVFTNNLDELDIGGILTSLRMT